MAGDRRSAASSVFDTLLDRNRQRFDELYTGKSPSSGRAATAPSARSAAPSGAPATDSASPVVRQLNERYGDGWSHRVVDRRRDGDEVIVLCRLSIVDGNVQKTQFGHARIGGGRIGAAGGGRVIAGVSGGVAFSVGTAGTGAHATAGNSEDDAYRRAVDDALAKCVRLL